MAKCVLRDQTVIGDFLKPYVVAEVNTSHNGSVETAKKMIDAAKESGCSCVKFQSWSAQSLYSKSYYKENPIAKRIVQKFAFSEAQLMEVAQHCRDQGVAFASTPYSEAEVDFLVEKCGAPYIKVASMDLVNYPFLEYIARLGVPIVLSTGMGTMEEVRKAVAAIEKAGAPNLCLLHCISIYPAEVSTIHLNNILGLRREFPDYPVGFSDHSIGSEIAIASVAMGAAMVEKHLTLDHTVIGMDNQMATEPAEMAQLVRSCLNTHAALGNFERTVSQAEMDQRKKMRRSVVAAKDLPAGTVLTIGDLDAKRPGTGLPPEKILELVGKVVVRDIEADTLISAADVGL
jgi:N-acetylneuraminate synthase